MQQRLNRIWYEGAAGAAWLAPLSALYGRVVAARRRAFESGRREQLKIPVPVVVVGNLTVGGTGKTPLVAWLAARLRERGLAAGIASRGHGGSGAGTRPVDAAGDWRCFGDEPVLLSRRTGCPVVVAPDRVAAARSLVAAGAGLVLCDDGLQHLRLGRDREIIVIDAARGLGNGRLLPAGPLREGVERLGFADAIVVNGDPDAALRRLIAQHGGPEPRVMRLQPGPIEPVAVLAEAPEFATAVDVTRPAAAAGAGIAGLTLDQLRGRRVHAVAGIGNPQRFFRMLESQGIEVIAHPFPDHHAFTPRELDFGDDLAVLMTEKDAVRCADFSTPAMGFVPVTAAFDAADAAALLACVQGAGQTT